MGDARDEPAIRPARPGDYGAIVELWHAAGLPTRPTGRDASAAFRRQLQRFPETYLVAAEGQRIVGVVLGTHDVRKGWINRLAVHPEQRRRGLARRLIAACEEALRAEGIEIIAALVEPHNEPSAAFFRSAGYVTDVPVLYFRKQFRPGV